MRASILLGQSREIIQVLAVQLDILYYEEDFLFQMELSSEQATAPKHLRTHLAHIEP